MVHGLSDTDPAAAPGIDWARYEPGLRRFLRRRVPAAAIDDLLQEVWVRLWSMRDPGSVRDMERYLFVVASNVLSLHHRRARPEASLDLISDGAAPIDELSPERALAGKERMQRAMTAIGEMPARTRQVFILHRFEEMTYQRIAREIGISVSAVEKHMMKALKVLTAHDRDAG